MKNVKKKIFSLILIAAIVGAVAIYALMSNQSKPSGTSGVFSVDDIGKVIATSDGKVTLEVPKNALLNQTDISINTAEFSAGEGYTVVSAYQFGPEGTSFTTPATLTMKYNPQTLPSGLNESDLRLFMSVKAGVGELENSFVDTANHAVSGQVTHFSQVFLGVHAAKAAAESTPPIVGGWMRHDGPDRYSFYANKTTVTGLNGKWYHGIWEYDGSGGHKYVLYWEHGPPGKDTFVDWITISDDGNSYTGHNNYDNSIYCTRINTPPKAVFNVTGPEGFKVNHLVYFYALDSLPNEVEFGVSPIFDWTITSPQGKTVAVATSTKTTVQEIPYRIAGDEAKFTPKIPGDYVVKLTLTDHYGATDESTKIFTVMPDVDISLSAIAGKYGPELDWTVTNRSPYSVKISTKAELQIDTVKSGSEFSNVGTSFLVDGHKTVTIAQQTYDEWVQFKGTVICITWWAEINYDHKDYPYSLTWGYNNPERPGFDQILVEIPVGK